MKKITFIREGKSISVEEGGTLLQAMRDAGLHPDAPCGGNGTCGKCLVKLVAAGKETSSEVVRACQQRINTDLFVDSITKESEMSILTSGHTKSKEYDPLVCQKEICVPPCSFGSSSSDWTRFVQASGQEDLVPDPGIVSMIGRLQKKNDGKMWGIFAGRHILAVFEKKQRFFTAAFDIGTTTIAGYLIDGENGQEAAIVSRQNPQASFGADVINRANYAIQHGTEEITACVRRVLDEMLQEMADSVGCKTDQIYGISVVGNTCMHHLLLGIDVSSLVHAPYNPAIQEAMILKASDYGLNANSRALLYCLPNIAGFVGADTVACLVSAEPEKQQQWTLLIDIGTNGEMVLAKNYEMIACSTAAGPAFEGAGILHGMRGSEGAISRVRWETDHWEYETIFGKKPLGICGSGLLDMAAELLRSGQMDESGELLGEKCIELASESESGKGERIVLVQKDIRELQLAKSAIASGIHLMAEKKEISVSEIAEVWLAGAFGSFMSPESAVRIGLIPPELRGRIRTIGNAAGEGAKRVLREASKWEHAQILSLRCEFLELAGMPEFQDRFVDELEFPDPCVFGGTDDV